MSTQFKLVPLPSRIIVQIDPFTYHGKLLIPDNAKRLPTTGTVLSVGSEVSQRGNVKVGDRVVVPMYSGTGLKFRDKHTQKELPPMRAVTEDEVLALIEGDVELEEAGA